MLQVHVMLNAVAARPGGRDIWARARGAGTASIDLTIHVPSTEEAGTLPSLWWKGSIYVDDLEGGDVVLPSVQSSSR
jgi:hypothetical protein